MNRPIKFRQWLSNYNIMGYFDLGGIDDGSVFDGHANHSRNFGKCTDECEGIGFDINENLLMQYTGLKDKNGKEIYEGDVIQTYYPEGQLCWRGVVEWQNESLRWDYSGVGFNIANDEIIEVIGNIFENPELVKK